MIRRSKMRTGVVVIVGLTVGGCAAPTTRRAAFAEIRDTIAERQHADVKWVGVSADDKALDVAVHGLLSKELTADDCVQIALLNNRNLQATFEDLGIARAELVQAGLLKNPVFDLSVRIPDRRPSKTYLDFAVAESFLDVLWLPARKKIAAASFEAIKARVTHAVLSLAADARSAFIEYQAAEQIVELRRTVAAAMDASATAAKALHDAGNTNDLELFTQQSHATRAKIELAGAEADALAAKEKATALMGLWGDDTTWKASARLPDLPATEVDPLGLESLAVRQRADLGAARGEVLTQSRTAGFAEATRFFAQADVGVEAERETEGQWRIGPTITVPVPVFDQGQGTVGRAQAMLRQTQHRYAALAVEIRSQVRSARSRLLAARAKAVFYRDELLPLQKRVVDETLRHYNGMYVGVFQLLQAKRDQIDAGREYVESLKEYWLARCELERAVGGRLPSTIATTQP